MNFAAIVSVLCCAGLTACGSDVLRPSPVIVKVYVVASDTITSPFTEELAPIIEKYGMATSLGHATSDENRTLYVLDATGEGVRLRSENVLLSGNEDEKLCGSYSEPHPDPGQYFISASATEANSGRATELLALIADDVKRAGYQVRREPLICSPLSKLQSDAI